ncbi:MAG: ferrochelatase [Alphaproteobacteria bacterium]|nr:ferrochelatase [Alphaproteobacteria bacterium]
MVRKKLAVVLFNLGGPDSLDAVKPFLFNLFYDKAIINLNNPWRWLLAKLISSRRHKKAQGIYSKIGGFSPLLKNTQAQALALENELAKQFDCEVKVFITMRYWYPRVEETTDRVVNFNPDEIILLPLYPQYSKTTTGSSIKDWNLEAAKKKINVPTKIICCYPLLDGYVNTISKILSDKLVEAKRTFPKVRILFSVHGLPEKIIKEGDPYKFHIEKTAKKIVENAGIQNEDWIVCYQSRVGPVKWIEPFLIDEIKRAGKDKIPVLVAPIGFVSEHSETLVELDIDMKLLSEKLGVPAFWRVPTVSTRDTFIKGLVKMVKDVYNRSEICPQNIKECEDHYLLCQRRLLNIPR